MFDELERRRGEVERNRENFARMAFAYKRFQTTGQGSIEFEQRVDFGLTFIEEPFMAYGSYIDVDELGDLLNVAGGEDVPLPITAGHVTKWDQDERDFYVGAWVAVNVYFPPVSNIKDVIVEPDLQPRVVHHFTFSAIAIKDVPPDLRD